MEKKALKEAQARFARLYLEYRGIILEGRQIAIQPPQDISCRQIAIQPQEISCRLI